MPPEEVEAEEAGGKVGSGADGRNERKGEQNQAQGEYYQRSDCMVETLRPCVSLQDLTFKGREPSNNNQDQDPYKFKAFPLASARNKHKVQNQLQSQDQPASA